MSRNSLSNTINAVQASLEGDIESYMQPDTPIDRVSPSSSSDDFDDGSSNDFLQEYGCFKEVDEDRPDLPTAIDLICSQALSPSYSPSTPLGFRRPSTPYIPTPNSTSKKKRAGPPMTKDSDSGAASKVLKLSVPWETRSAVIEKHLQRKYERDTLKYNVSKARSVLKKELQLLEEHEKSSGGVLIRDLAVIEVEKERWEAMWDHELSVHRQRLCELEEKKQDLDSFGEILDYYRHTGVGEDDLLAYLEACKPVY